MVSRGSRQRTFPLFPRRGESGRYFGSHRFRIGIIGGISVLVLTPLWIRWMMPFVWSSMDDAPVVDYNVEIFRPLYNHFVTFSLDQMQVQLLIPTPERPSVWTVPNTEEDFQTVTMNTINALHRSETTLCQVFCRFPQPTFELEHFPHFLQQAYPCWSMLKALGGRHHYIILPAKLSEKLSYIHAVLRIMKESESQIKILYANESLPVERCDVTDVPSTQPPKGMIGSTSALLVEKMFSDSGWDRPTRYFLTGDDSFGIGVTDWQRGVLKEEFYKRVKIRQHASERIRMNVLILDRKGTTRAFRPAAKMKRLLETASRKVIDPNHYTKTKVKYISSFSGYTLQKQALAMHEADIIFSPHGAQLSNLIYIRPCTVVVEFFPRSYYLQFFQSLVVVARGLSYEAYPFDGDKLGDTQVMLQNPDPNAKGQARSGPIDCAPESVAEALPRLVDAVLKCRKELGYDWVV